MCSRNPKLDSPAYSTGARDETQITSSCEKQQFLSAKEREGSRCREPLKGPTHKLPFAATYPGLQQAGLEPAEECLWLVALGKALKTQ